MTKKHIYIVTALIIVVLMYVFFMSAAVTKAPGISESVGEVTIEEVLGDSAELLDEVEIEAGPTDQTEEIVLTGTFVGLLEEITPHGKTYKYMLLNDGMEVLRIDLRPLVGFSSIDIIEKLGVDRGDSVTVEGTLREGRFSVTSVQ